MTIININEQIENWKNNSKSPDDNWNKIANYLTEFRELATLEKYISDDSESYWDNNCYKNLLEGISELTIPDIIISEISTMIQGDKWIFDFKINDKLETLEFKNPNTDWFENVFLEKLNSILSKYGSQKKLRMVFATSEFNTDQCFDLCFINDETFKKLLENSPKYAFE